MLALSLTSPAEILKGIATRIRRRRIDFNLTQRELASRSGVSYGSLRLLEETGKASLESVVKIAFALEAESEFDTLFPPRPARTLDEIIGRTVRQRVRKK